MKYLVVRGVMSTDELGALGLPLAIKFDEADTVALIARSNKGIIVKGAGAGIAPALVEYFDADPSSGRIARAINRVKDAYEATDAPIIGWGSETAVGMFLLCWPIFDTTQTVMNAIEQGDIANVEAAADQFIATGFGANLGALAMIPEDEHRSDVAGHAADGASS